MARNPFERRLSDGRKLGDIPVHELPALAQACAERAAAALVRAALLHVGIDEDRLDRRTIEAAEAKIVRRLLESAGVAP
jgi:hypothetical protein